MRTHLTALTESSAIVSKTGLRAFPLLVLLALVLSVTACGGNGSSGGNDPAQSLNDPLDNNPEDGGTDDPTDGLQFKTGVTYVNGYVYYPVGDLSNACDNLFPFELAVNKNSAEKTVATFRERKSSYADYPITSNAFSVVIKDDTLDTQCKMTLSNDNKDVAIACVNASGVSCSDHFKAASTSPSGQLASTIFFTQNNTCTDFPSDKITIGISGNRAIASTDAGQELVLRGFQEFKFKNNTLIGALDSKQEFFRGENLAGSCSFVAKTASTSSSSSTGDNPPQEGDCGEDITRSGTLYEPCD